MLTISFNTFSIIHLYFITCSSKKCHCMDKVVELSIPFEPNKFVASSLECDRGTHLFKIASQRFSAQNVVFLSVVLCCMVLLSIAHFSLFSGNVRLVSLEDKLSSSAYFTLIWI